MLGGQAGESEEPRRAQENHTMIKNFETIKQQLNELSGVINSFKSEAVQLRIVELIFGAKDSEGTEIASLVMNALDIPQRRRKNRTRTVARPNVSRVDGNGDAKRRGSSGSGPVSTVTQLAAGDFFKQSRTINDILEHCQNALARRFKANEISGKLGRMVRNRELTRQKNADGQYEYKKA